MNKPDENLEKEKKIKKEKSEAEPKPKKRTVKPTEKKDTKKADDKAADSFTEELAVDEEISVDDDGRIDAPSLDSLLYDSESAPESGDEEPSSKKDFENFLADYKAIIGKSLAMAKSALQKDEEEETQPEETKKFDEDKIEEIPLPPEAATEETAKSEEGEKCEETNAAPPIEEPLPHILENPESENSQFKLDLGGSEEADVDKEADTEHIYNPEKPRIIDSVFDFFELFIFTLAAVLIITTFFFKHTIVDGGSMMNTLQDGEHLIISDLFYTPERGDIVVFADYSVGQTKPYVKRVIGVAGDKISVDAEGRVKVNGVALEEDYVFVDGHFPAGYYGKECIVPEGEVFVLGDHRNASSDSATFPNTTVKVESILGKVLLRVFPFNKFGTVD